MKQEKDLLELDSRRRIYERVRQTPGLHLRALARELGMPLGTLEYHTHQMEKVGLLVTRGEGWIKAFFAQDLLDRRDRDLMFLLRQKTPRRLALEIVGKPGIGFQGLAERLRIAPSTLSFHLAKLRRTGLVEERLEGRQKSYSCTDSERVRKLIVQYRSTFVDDVVDRFADAWLDLGLS